jgi:hypothetical protein
VAALTQESRTPEYRERVLGWAKALAAPIGLTDAAEEA